MLFQAVRATKESHANPLMARKHVMHHQTKGNVEKRILNTRAINATTVEEKQRHSLESCPAFGHECKVCKNPNHIASVSKSSQKCLIKQLTALSDAEQETDTDTDTDTDEFFYKVEVSLVQARGKQFSAPLEFCDPDVTYKTKLDCQ